MNTEILHQLVWIKWLLAIIAAVFVILAAAILTLILFATRELRKNHKPPTTPRKRKTKLRVIPSPKSGPSKPSE